MSENEKEQNEEQKKQEETVNIIDMSDEDFLKTESPVSFEEEQEQEKEKKEDEEQEKEPDKEESSDEDENEEKSSNEDEENEEESSEDIKEEKENKEDKEEISKEEEQKESKKKEIKKFSKQDTLDYKSEYEKVMSPFVANGVEMKPKSVDDIIRLMQMGANYHKKMAGLKPSMRILKLLEKNDLLDQEKLNYLIDLHSKDPVAITKLIKDSGINPLELDLEKDLKYKPTSRNVSDTELDLDSVLDSIKDTSSYNKTLTIITQKWDDKSRSTIANNPHIISVINEHVANGTYKKVMGAVEYERSLGNLQGVPDFEAYKQIGDALQKAGQLESSSPPSIIKQKSKTRLDRKKRQAKKKAASPTGNGGKSATPSFSPLEMSDEEIEKFDESKLPAV